MPTPDTLRGLYVNRWAALGKKLTDLIGVAKTTEINALVIDVKDDRKKAGYDNGFQSWILWNPKSNYTIAALEPRP